MHFTKLGKLGRGESFGGKDELFFGHVAFEGIQVEISTNTGLELDREYESSTD